MLLSLDGLAATPFAPSRVKLLLLHAGEALHLFKGSPDSQSLLCVWVCCKGSLFGLAQNAMLGAVYILPV